MSVNRETVLRLMREKRSLLKQIRDLHQANDMQSKRIDWTVQDNVRQAIEISDLNKVRLQDAKEHEQAMRVLIKVFCKRGDVIQNLKSKAENWKNVAIAANRRIIKSEIRQGDRVSTWISLCSTAVEARCNMAGQLEKAYRKIIILKAKIRHDDRSFAKVKLCKCK